MHGMAFSAMCLRLDGPYMIKGRLHRFMQG